MFPGQESDPAPCIGSVKFQLRNLREVPRGDLKAVILRVGPQTRNILSRANLLEIQTLSSHPRLTDSENLQQGPPATCASTNHQSDTVVGSNLTATG